MRTRRSWRNQDRLFRYLFANPGTKAVRHRSPRKKSRKIEPPPASYAIGVLEIGPDGAGMRALRLCLTEIEQFHSRAYPDCDGGCPAHEAMAAARAVLCD